MSYQKISASLNKALARHLNWNVIIADTNEDKAIAAYERIIEKYAKWCIRAKVSPLDLCLDWTDGRDVIRDYIQEYINEQA